MYEEHNPVFVHLSELVERQGFYSKNRIPLSFEPNAEIYAQETDIFKRFSLKTGFPYSSDIKDSSPGQYYIFKTGSDRMNINFGRIVSLSEDKTKVFFDNLGSLCRENGIAYWWDPSVREISTHGMEAYWISKQSYD